MKMTIEKTTIQVPDINEFKKIIVPKGRFCSDTFVCADCGARGIYKVLGDKRTCPECGGTMYRQ